MKTKPKGEITKKLKDYSDDWLEMLADGLTDEEKLEALNVGKLIR